MEVVVGFQSRFLKSWFFVGIIPFGAFFAATMLSSELGILSVFLGLLTGIMASFAYGGLGMLVDAGFRHKFKFVNIKHPVWMWHIYPIIGLFDAAFTLTIWMLKMAFKFK